MGALYSPLVLPTWLQLCKLNTFQNFIWPNYSKIESIHTTHSPDIEQSLELCICNFKVSVQDIMCTTADHISANIIQFTL